MHRSPFLAKVQRGMTSTRFETPRERAFGAGQAPERLWNIPNAITLSRLALTPVVCVLIFLKQDFWALVVFTLASATDALDGYLARRLGQTSVLGRQLDPLVDKMIVISAMVFLVVRPGSGLAPWMLAAIVARELVVQAVRSQVEGRGAAFGARWSGKLKTLLQCLAVAAILACSAFQAGELLTHARNIIIWAATLVTVLSGLEYLWAAAPLLLATDQN